MSGGSDLFYLFIFAIWLRRDVERKREKSRCAQLLAAALTAQNLIPSPAPGPAELEATPRPAATPRAPGDGSMAPAGTRHVPGGDEVWIFTGRQAQPGCPALDFQHLRCWPYAGLVAIVVGTARCPQTRVTLSPLRLPLCPAPFLCFGGCGGVCVLV